MSNLPWIEKYRPNNLDEIIDHKLKIETLRNLIKKNELPHLLFYGPSGTGKTSLILACAKEFYGDQYKRYILELNASDDRGIDTVRCTIVNFVKMSSNKIRLVILDEADALTNIAQRALRKIIEKYSSNSRFCLICNNISKIIPGLQSRCAKMRFGYLDNEKIKVKLLMIVKNENIKISEKALDLLIYKNKDMRQILNILQCLNSLKNLEDKEIICSDIYSYMGIPPDKEINDIIYIIINNSLSESCKIIYSLFLNNTWDLANLVNTLTNYIMNNIEKYNDEQIIYIFGKLSDIESKISCSNDHEIQLYALISAFNYIHNNKNL